MLVVLLLLLALSLGTPAPPAQAAASPDILRDAAAAHNAGDIATTIRLYREFLKNYPDAAEIRSNWTVVQNSPDGPKIGSGGAYHDQMVKQGGRWLFRYRKIDRFIAA